MNLTDFSPYLSKESYSQGYELFRDGKVTKIHEPYRGHFVIEVEEAENYAIDIVLDDGNNIVQTFCECHSVPGAYCVHTAAALLALGRKEENVMDLKGPAVVSEKERMDLDAELASLPRQELVRFLREAALEHPDVKKQVLARPPSEAPSASDRKFGWGYTEKEEEEDGFMAFPEVAAVQEGAQVMVERAEEKAADGEVEQAVHICLTVLSEIVHMLEHAGDSGGEPGMVVHHMLETLHQAAALGTFKLSEREKEQVFDLLLSEAARQWYDDAVERCTSLLRACIYLADSSNRRERLEDNIEQFLNRTLEDSWRKERQRPLFTTLLLDIRGTFDSEEELWAYLYDNLDYPEFRQKALNLLFHKKEYVRVLELCNEALKTEEKPNLRRNWKEYKLHAYKQLGEAQKAESLSAGISETRR
ncbi:SWIM zinc finger family protein [Salibacterium aidingense]|uniref:SWIM zinc finger family protein n=1 Tax=Salibacterium aidingense TaxID=384933 RepID=UPI003BD4BE1B